MAIYRMNADSLQSLQKTTFSGQGIRERFDLQRLLRDNIGVITNPDNLEKPGVLIIAEEFSSWDDSKRRIDLLGIDSNANLLVFELKRDEDGGHMELQAIRYAAMVRTMTFEQAVAHYQDYLDTRESGADARQRLLDFLAWDEPQEGRFAQEVRIVLVAADFGKELTSSVLWLNECKLDIRCVRLMPYSNGDQVILDVQQILPLPEASEYMMRIRDKTIAVREAIREGDEDTGYWFMNVGEVTGEDRSWEDCRKYRFLSAGGGPQWSGPVRKLQPGNMVFAYLSKHGYVGLGTVVKEAVPLKDFIPPGETKPLPQLPLSFRLNEESSADPEHWEWAIEIDWKRTLPRSDAVKDLKPRRRPLCKIWDPDLVANLLREFDSITAST
ncbi:MAG: hypothetical protein IT432_00680 [Phycisphaerales bacterium]|nr:hypothetical protein [Phycisphaerales bacterium]